MNFVFNKKYKYYKICTNNVCSPLPLRFAIFHFDPKGLFIFKNCCFFWPILASTAGNKKGPFTSFEAILVSRMRHVPP